LKIIKAQILLFFLCSTFSFAQITIENQTPLLRTFGFIIGQQNTLDYIKANFPEQSNDAIMAELTFHKIYGEAVNEIKSEVKEIYGEAYNDNLTDLKISFRTYLNSGKMTKNDAALFVEQVKTRSKGNIKSPYIATLLKYKYRHNPVDEFLENKINIHSIKSYSNSEKIEFAVKIPKSWKEIDGVFPLVLKKFRSDYGMGKEIITISIDRLNYENNKQFNINKVLMKEEILKIIPENSHILSVVSKKINNRQTGVLKYEEINPEKGSDKKRIVTQYTILNQNNLLRIDCATYGTANENLRLKVKKLEQLYLLIFKSIHLKNNKENTIVTYKQ